MYDKPLKIQWTEINGRAVPLVLPQFWDDQQDDWVVSSADNRLPVDAQLTGSNVEKTLIERGVYQNNPPAVLESNIPDGARGCMISVIVYGVTGSFENDEGLRLIVTQRGGVNKLLNAYDFGAIQTEMTTNDSNHVVILYPSIDLTNFIALGEVNAVSIPPFGTLRIGVSVTGTFAEGEGFDLSATIQYLQ